MSTSKRFTGKVALVTGGASGIGRATALMFAKEGADVVIADVSEKQGMQVEAELKKLSTKSYFKKCDVSSEKEVKELIDSTVSGLGRIDCAFNNAGIEGNIGEGISQISSNNWDRILGINLKGIWLCMKYELLQMAKQGRGSIVNCSSVAGLVGFAGGAAYSASKHGVVGLTKSAALEYAKLNVRINAVCPGVINTPMVQRIVDEEPAYKDGLTAGEPVGRMGTPEEIGDAVLWMCAESASFVTGQAIAIDGGWTTQ